MAQRNRVRSIPAAETKEDLKPLKLNEKTKAQVLAISQTIQQAETLLMTIAATLRDVHGAPDSWQLVQQPDGLYLMDAPTAPDGLTDEIAEAAKTVEAIAARGAAAAKRAQKRMKRRAVNVPAEPAPAEAVI